MTNRQTILVKASMVLSTINWTYFLNISRTGVKQTVRALWRILSSSETKNEAINYGNSLPPTQYMLCSTCISFQEMTSHRSSNNPSTTNKNHHSTTKCKTEPKHIVKFNEQHPFKPNNKLLLKQTHKTPIRSDEVTETKSKTLKTCAEN